MKTTAVKLMAVLAVFAVFASSQVAAQGMGGQPAKPIEELAGNYRNGMFHGIDFNYQLMNGMYRGSVEKNDELFLKAASDLHTLSGLVTVGFVMGTQEYAKLSTDAVWDDQEDFNNKMEDFQTKAGVLATAAEGGVDSAESDFNSLRQTCGGCHRNYRQRVTR